VAATAAATTTTTKKTATTTTTQFITLKTRKVGPRRARKIVAVAVAAIPASMSSTAAKAAVTLKTIRQYQKRLAQLLTATENNVLRLQQLKVCSASILVGDTLFCWMLLLFYCFVCCCFVDGDGKQCFAPAATEGMFRYVFGSIFFMYSP
jgi:hypothetical protein